MANPQPTCYETKRTVSPTEQKTTVFVEKDTDRMKNSTKVTLTLVIFVLLICFLGAIWNLMKKEETYQPNPTRPDDFPDVLIAPEEAESTDYFASTAPGVYILEYVIREPYPGTKTQDRIARRLMFHGFRRPAYDLLNPQFPRGRKWKIDDRVRGNQTESHWLSEKWINANDEVVSVILTYPFPVGGGPDPDELHVHIIFYEKDSWIGLFVRKYKELHPEDFRENSELKEDN
jgi:hypothetical protein